MLPRQIAILAATVLALGGAVALASSGSFRSQPVTPPSIAPSSDTQVAEAPSPEPEHARTSWLKDLNLTPEQVQKVQSVRRQYQKPMTQQRQVMRQTMQELQTLMAGDASNDEIRQKYSQLKTLKQQLADTQFESMLATREVLTVPQRRRFADFMQKQRKNLRERIHEDKPL